jgi:hypothetical protein
MNDPVFVDHGEEEKGGGECRRSRPSFSSSSAPLFLFSAKSVGCQGCTCYEPRIDAVTFTAYFSWWQELIIVLAVALVGGPQT